MIRLPVRLPSNDFGPAARVAARVRDKEAGLPRPVPVVPVPVSPASNHSPKSPDIYSQDAAANVSHITDTEASEVEAVVASALAAVVEAAVREDRSNRSMSDGDPTPPLSPPLLPPPPPSVLPTPHPSTLIGSVSAEERDVPNTPFQTPPPHMPGAAVEPIGRTELWRQMVKLDLEATGAGFADGEESPLLASIARENARVLDQGVVLPCAPSDEEKVTFG